MFSSTSQSECGMLPHKRHFVMFAAEHTAFFSTFILYSKTSLLTNLSRPHTSVSQRQSSTLDPSIRLCMIIGMREGPCAIPLPIYYKANLYDRGPSC